ncbi:sex-regulated protein janus-A isoform X1 [Andrena cerasifolii]|uniref:sex-regulated protein janus-A isoform X1 n=1 Tax=Andrena cerasifolii TaxID=2819439 RepID=UPI004037CA74
MAVSFMKIRTEILNCHRGIFKAVFSNNSRIARMSQPLNKVPDVDIDSHGRFKYILINVQDKSNNASKFIVRGYARAEWHADIFDETLSQLEQFPELRAKCVGGGRIEHNPDDRTIKVYGHSQGFGQADHEISASILKKKYPDYTLTCSNEGY